MNIVGYREVMYCNIGNQLPMAGVEQLQPRIPGAVRTPKKPRRTLIYPFPPQILVCHESIIITKLCSTTRANVIAVR